MSMDFGHLGKNKGLIVLILLRRPLVVINGLDEIHLSQGYSRSLNHPNRSLIFELYLCICNVLLANRNNESILFYFIFNMVLNIILTYFKGFTYLKEIGPAYNKMYQMLIAVSHNFTNVVYSTNIFFKYTVKFCIYDIMTGLRGPSIFRLKYI